jgi:hypothetical protein
LRTIGIDLGILRNYQGEKEIYTGLHGIIFPPPFTSVVRQYCGRYAGLAWLEIKESNKALF